MKKSRGFTLIELVMVIVILGILAAVALPKFANLKGDARAASILGAAGAINSAMTIVHSQSLVNGTESAATSTVTLEGASIAIVYGYPTIASISVAAGLGANDYTNTAGVISLSPAITNCNVTYVNATSSLSPTSTIVTSSC